MIWKLFAELNSPNKRKKKELTRSTPNSSEIEDSVQGIIYSTENHQKLYIQKNNKKIKGSKIKQ
jgi:hypothetical protein